MIFNRPFSNNSNWSIRRSHVACSSNAFVLQLFRMAEQIRLKLNLRDSKFASVTFLSWYSTMTLTAILIMSLLNCLALFALSRDVISFFTVVSKVWVSLSKYFFNNCFPAEEVAMWLARPFFCFKIQLSRRGFFTPSSSPSLLSDKSKSSSSSSSSLLFFLSLSFSGVLSWCLIKIIQIGESTEI